MIECFVCDSTVKTLDDMESHIKAEHDYVELGYGFTGMSFTCYCDSCGEEFDRNASQIGQNQFCQPDCVRQFGGKDKSDSETPYADDFAEIREQAMERDNYRCVDCEIPRTLHQEIVGQDLEAHHIERVCRFDDPAKAHTLDNVVTLCKRCHRLRHYRETYS